MSRNYLSLKQFLDTNFIGIDEVNGANYPPPWYGEVIASCTSFAWMLGMVLIIFGKNIFAGLGMPEPTFFGYIKNNKIFTGFILFYLNAYGARFLSTGAFEIYLNGEEIFSKLKTGNFPTAEIIIEELMKRGIHYVAKS